MPLCGAAGCNCEMVSAPATANPFGGEYPSINVAGNGVAGDPYLLSANPLWANAVATRFTTDTAWNTWVPTLLQPATITKTNSLAIYQRSGANLKTYTIQFYLSISSSGTAGQILRMSGLPAQADVPVPPLMVGSGMIMISTTRYRCAIMFVDADTVQFVSDRAATATQYWGQVPSANVQSGTAVRGTFTYQAL